MKGGGWSGSRRMVYAAVIDWGGVVHCMHRGGVVDWGVMNTMVAVVRFFFPVVEVKLGDCDGVTGNQRVTEKRIRLLVT